MCDRQDLAGWDRKVASAGVSRRGFGALTGAAALAACSDGGAQTEGAIAAGRALTESRASIATDDGEMDAFFVHPATGRHPAVIVWPDIASLRESKRNIARRLAAQGYAVLVANPYYRDVPGDRFESSVAFREEGGFDLVEPWRDKLDSDAVMRDATALVDWLDAQDAVDTGAGIGTQGYCMGGPFSIYTAHARPDRIAAAASFHGGGLVREDKASPHRILEPRTSYLFAIARNDDARAPEEKTALRAAADAKGVDAEIEVYDGDHGWTVPDNPAYERGSAERAWTRLLALYEGALRS